MFHAVWGTHQCEVTGCGMWLTCDGGMKPHRNVCAARYSGVITYKHSNTQIVSGCTKKPSPGSQFCPDHKKDTGLVVLSEQLSKETKAKLRQTRSLIYPQDNIFFVRTLMKHDKKSDMFLVRWAKFPDDAMTWEPRKSLPVFVVSWYEKDQTRFGCEIPAPRVKDTKEVGRGRKMAVLEWEESAGPVDSEHFQGSM